MKLKVYKYFCGLLIFFALQNIGLATPGFHSTDKNFNDAILVVHKYKSYSDYLNHVQKKINNFRPKFKDDKFAIVALKNAIIAARTGNVGIGACLVRIKDGVIIASGHNQAHSPYFRSDLHAEMNVLDKFENKMRSYKSAAKDLALYTTVEPCAMCLARIIFAGVGNTYYLVPDIRRGMVNKIDTLPDFYRELARKRVYKKADCSPRLRKIAYQIWAGSVEQLNKKSR